MTINYQFPFYPYNNYQQPTCGGYGFQPTTMYNQQNPYRGFENSYIENILRMNLGKNATIYMNFENSQWGSKVFKGEPAPFVMELPQYHIPSAKTVLLHVWEKLKGFIIKAGTILFLACVVMWFLSGYGFVNGSFGAVEDPGNSLLAVIGGAIAPIFAPLGFGNWKAVAASLSGFSAKESIVTTMGVLANVTGDASEDAVTVAQAVRTWFPTSVAAFSFLLFNLLDSPCLAAIATMAKELQSRKWFWFAILFQNVFAYVITLIVYQIGSFAMGGAFTVGTAVGIVFLLVLLFLLFRPDPYKNQKVYSKRSVQA